MKMCIHQSWKMKINIWLKKFALCITGWLYDSWNHNYLVNQCLSPLMLWIRIPLMARCTTLCDKVCQWLATGGWFSPGTPVDSTNKTDCHDITKILLKLALNTLKRTKKLCNIVISTICPLNRDIYDNNRDITVS
jgi:hypothetical protein